MIFRLAELWQEPDFELIRQAIPQSVFEGWKTHYRREPWGSEHLYQFLARSFVMLAQAFHVPQYAFDLKQSSFLWWLPADDQEIPDDYWDSDEDAERLLDMHGKHMRHGSEN